MKTPCFDTVILSDLHLGSEVSRAEAALQMLKANSFRRLILLGDIFCDLNFRRLQKEHWRFLSYIRKLSNPKRNVEVIWVEGNHDFGLTEVMSHLVGVTVHQEYEWDFCGIRHLAIHGHQFDRFVVNNRVLSNIFTAIHHQLQKMSFGQKRIVGFLERFDTVWLRLSSKVAAGAIAHAKTRKADRIFCGHTHEATHIKTSVEYFNTGSWTQSNATYITIDEQGVNIHEYDQRVDDSHPSEERSETDLDAPELIIHAGLPGDVEYQSVFG
ncbi:MAG: UDP-2,3-diacylglucosamine diphosphatase [Acidobacteriota bacterium]|nr:UDP-2,3-diacylglucosamine diphosphatase [Acidobacteriota bacterium]